MLCRENIAQDLLDSARFYDEIGRWYLWLILVMPDHVHLIATFDLGRGLQPIMKAWKGYQKRNLHVEWQADFFEHRLRNADEFVEKACYVRMNPVRQGLVDSPDAWPYVLARTDLAEELGAVIGGAKPPAEPRLSDKSAARRDASPHPEGEETENA